MPRYACALVLFALSLEAQKLPFDVQAMLNISRISEPRISPDGKLIAFTVQTVDLAQNTKPKQIYVMPIDGGTPQAITTQGTRNERPRWSPDSRRIAFISNRGGSAQVWMMSADGTQPKQITSVSTEADGVLFSPDGKKLVFTSSVYPDCPDDNCNRERLEAEKESKVKARTYTTLLYRHWTDWQGKRRSHLLTVSADGGAAKDLTPGGHPGNSDVPPFSLGGADDYAISPDSTQLCYVMNSDPVPATSTNTDLYTVALTGGESKRITSNPGADNAPQYSPDGKFIAYRSQERGGYESDRWRLTMLEIATGSTTVVTDSLDRSVASFTWSPDSARLFFTTEDRGRHVLSIIPAQGGASRLIASGPSNIDDVQLTSDGKTMIYTEQSASQPVEIYRTNSAGVQPVALTHLNDTLLAGYSLRPLEELWVEAPDKTRVHSFILKPDNMQRGRKYPVLFLIHGGPQGAWHDEWHARWNYQMFASTGCVVVAVNPRGSTGYGQKFTDQISRDWTGRVYEDLMKGLDHALKTYSFLDSDRVAAAGGSYGGFMVNWIAGHTDRFKALISHAGVFDLTSKYGTTEELWFPEWEFGGTPWETPEIYRKQSP
ncbi:MAG: S9 family peptidase, partial [Nitrospirota bacterium]